MADLSLSGDSPVPRVTHAVSDDALLSVLHEADGLLSLVGWRHAEKVGHDLADELKAASGRCRLLVAKIEGKA